MVKHKALLFFLTLLPLGSFIANCSSEKEVKLKHGGLFPSKVTIHVKIPDMGITPVGTRASEVDEMYVMTFDTSGNMTDVPQVATIEDGGTIDERYFVATLNGTDQPRTVLVVVNSKAEMLTFMGDTNSSIDFSNYTLLGVCGNSPHIPSKIDIAFSKNHCTNQYILNVETTGFLTMIDYWYISILTPKIDNSTDIILNVKHY